MDGPSPWRRGVTRESTSGFHLRNMVRRDLKRVRAILRETIPDDADEAFAEIKGHREGRLVLADADVIAGLTGSREIPDTDRSRWLGWTCLDLEFRKQVTGADLVLPFLDVLRGEGVRKLFALIGESDVAPGGTKRYGGAIEFYEELGFTVEARHRDYYALREGVAVLGYRLADLGEVAPPPADPGPMVVTDADEIFDTDDAYYFEWEYFEGGAARNHFADWIEKVRKWRGRNIFVGLPGHAQTASDQLRDAGFVEDGRVTDLIDDGTDEVRYRYDLE